MKATDIVNIRVTFTDEFSGAVTTREITRSHATFMKMKKGIGTATVSQFESHIKWLWKVTNVEQI